MKRFLCLSAIVLASAVFTTSADAAVTYSASGPVTSDPGQPNSTVIDNFNGDVASGVTISAYSLPGPATSCTPGAANCNAQYVTAAQDAGVPAGLPASQKALDVSQGNGVGFTVIDFSNLNLDSVSFYWGSVDNWNTVQLLSSSGNQILSNGVQQPGSILSGGTLITQTCDTTPSGPGVTCDQGYFDHAGSQRVTFSWNPAVDNVGQLQFIDSPYPAFEVANITGTPVSAAPEPSTWALMILGIGGIGMAFRQAKRNHGFRFKDAFAA